MVMRARILAGVVAGVALLGVSGCGGSKTTAASTSAPAARPPVATSAPVPAPSRAAAGAPGAPGSARSTSGGAKTCPSGDVTGEIGGQSKCLGAGEECSAKHVGNYPRYGFACVQQGGKYVLTKR